MKFGSFIEARLAAIKKSQRQLARELGLSNSYISDALIRGEQPPSQKWLDRHKSKLAKALDLSQAHIEKAMAEARGEDTSGMLSMDKALLMALAEEESPTEDMKLLLERIRRAAGFALSSETYKAILRDFHTATSEVKQ